MTHISQAILVSLVAPALLLSLLLESCARRLGLQPRGAKWCLGLGLTSLLLVTVPIGGLPIARWIAGFVDHWSVPLLVFLASALLQRFFGIVLFRARDRQAAWVFGALAGVVLYPGALGWGGLDPYGWGWKSSPLFAAMAVYTGALVWRNNRFGAVLLLAVAAWHLGVPESGNYWDCLVDPFYFVSSLAVLAWSVGAIILGAHERPTNLAGPGKPGSSILHQ